MHVVEQREVVTDVLAVMFNRDESVESANETAHIRNAGHDDASRPGVLGERRSDSRCINEMFEKAVRKHDIEVPSRDAVVRVMKITEHQVCTQCRRLRAERIEPNWGIVYSPDLVILSKVGNPE
jgi:hypothetical protein